MAFSACGRAEAAARTQQQRPMAVPVKGTFRRRVQDAAVAATVTVQEVQGTPARQPRQPLAVACAQPLRAAGARAYTIISPSGTASHGILANTRVQGGARGGPACVTAGHTLKNGSRRGALRFSLACYTSDEKGAYARTPPGCGADQSRQVPTRPGHVVNYYVPTAFVPSRFAKITTQFQLRVCP